MSKHTRERHAQHTAAPPAGAWWNNIRRLWFTGSAEAAVALDPQPPPPSRADVDVPLAAKVFL